MNKYEKRILRQDMIIRKQERRIERLEKSEARNLRRINELNNMIWGNKLAKNEAEAKIADLSEQLLRGKW